MLIAILVLLLALAGAVIAYQLTSYRADRLENDRNRWRARAQHFETEARRLHSDIVVAENAARRFRQDAARFRRDAINARGRLSKYLLSEDEQLASLPTEVRRIPDVDAFINDVLHGGR